MGKGDDPNGAAALCLRLLPDGRFGPVELVVEGPFLLLQLVDGRE